MKKQFKYIGLVTVLITSLTSWSWAEEITLSDGLSKLQSILYFAEDNYYEELSEQKLLDASYSGLFDAMDPHSIYFTEDAYAAFSQSSEGYFYGVGISIEPDGDYIRVVSPIEGSPAAKEDIQAGDLIISVNGKSIKGMSIDEVINMIRGEEGTPVTLGFQREGLNSPLIITLNRGRVEVNPVTYEVKEGNIGYMRISQFSSNLVEHYDQALDALINESKVNSLIIDLRYNPGGSLTVVLETLERLLPPDKPILHVDYRAYDDESYYTDQPGYDLPIVVLVNEWSASASEIFSGTLQDLGRAQIVGVTSYGKGTVQQTYPLTDGSGVKITVAQYLTGGKNAINKIGVHPNYVVENISPEVERIAKAFAPMSTYQDSIVGAKDLDTLGAQQRLNYLGYELREDGYFDGPTEAAIAQFQIDKGLLNSGILNWETKQALSKAVEQKAAEQVEDLQLQKAMELLNEANSN